MTEKENAKAGAENAVRKLSWLLIVGIILLPIVFVWFLLREGYGTAARAFGFSWAGVFLLLLVLSPPPSDDAEKGQKADVSKATDQADSEEPIPDQLEGNGEVEKEGAGETDVPRPPPLSEEKRKGFHCLSSWDGSHRGLKTFVRERLRDPSSFDHVETRISLIDNDDQHRLVMTYRAKNGFGGTNVERASARISNKGVRW